MFNINIYFTRMKKNFLKSSLLVAFAAVALSTGFVSCDDDDDESTLNPAEQQVMQTKSHDTALLLCTFGSTYNESLAVYDDIIKDFKSEFPDVDIYMSFTSRTCINRVQASTGIERYELDQWLKAIGNAGYKRLAVQSLHVIPGEEYLSLMNTDIKKSFMIQWFPKIDVLKGANLLSTAEDTEAVASILFKHYAKQLQDKNSIVLLMGHGNPDENYSANGKYVDVQNALQAKAVNKNIFVGTVDYGDMLFWPKEEEENPADRIMDANEVRKDYPSCIYSQIMQYCEDNNLKPSDVKVYLTPFMSIAGDHAHNDLWGLEALAEGTNVAGVDLSSNEFSWRERLSKIGFQVQTEFESHPLSQVGADHGIVSGCGIRALGSYPEIRQIWVKHLREQWNQDAWENGKDYQ